MTANFCFERILIERTVKDFRMSVVKIVDLKGFLNMILLTADLADLIIDVEVDDDETDDELVSSLNESSRSDKMF